MASSGTHSARRAAVTAAYFGAEDRFIAANPSSQSLYNSATEHLPGGNTRSVLHWEPFPLFISRASGCTLWDTDGHSYVDLLGDYSAGLYGHSEPVITTAIASALADGLSFGGPHVHEQRLASLIRERFPSIERVRFTNSGTEATLAALSLAKAFTSRSRILVFDGAYHGGGFFFVNSAAGSPVNVPHDYVFAVYNSAASVTSAVSQQGADSIAAIIVEPMLGAGGGVQATPEFLRSLRQTCNEIGALLIFDEVMTSRLYSGSGVQGELGITPDLTVLGKYIGGGSSFGAFGGRRDIMEMFDSRKPGALPHAGTFNNNVLTMRAGVAGLEKVFTPVRARELHAAGEALRQRLNFAAAGSLMKVLGCGSILAFHFTAEPLLELTCPGDWREDEIGELFDLFHLDMLHRGFYLARRGYVALSLAVGQDELDGFERAVEGFIDEYAGLLRL